MTVDELIKVLTAEQDKKIKVRILCRGRQYTHFDISKDYDCPLSDQPFQTRKDILFFIVDSVNEERHKTPIFEIGLIGLSDNIVCQLAELGIFYIEDLLLLDDDEILNIKGIGRKIFNKIRCFLREFELRKD